MISQLNKGDYVLATKYSDGSPKDQFCIGLYDGQERDRHFVVDENGQQFRHTGFRRVAKITQERGDFLVKNISLIEQSDRSLWWWKRTSIKKFNEQYRNI